MTAPESTLNGAPLVSGALRLPWAGRWHGDFVVDTLDPPSGPVSLVLLGTSYTGTVLRSGVLAGRVTVRVVGGAGGLDRELSPKNWINGASVGSLLSETLGQVAEGLSLSSSPSVTSLLFPRWTRPRGTAGEEITRIATKAGGEIRQLPDGTFWIGTDSWSDAGLDYELIDLFPAERRMVIAAETAAVLPGQSVDGRRIVEVEHQISPGQARSHLWFEET